LRLVFGLQPLIHFRLGRGEEHSFGALQGAFVEKGDWILRLDHATRYVTSHHASPLVILAMYSAFEHHRHNFISYFGELIGVEAGNDESYFIMFSELGLT
jgi:hypothetical protein